MPLFLAETQAVLVLCLLTCSSMALAALHPKTRLPAPRHNASDLSYDDVRGRSVKVAYDSRAILIDGQRVLLRSGCVHYPRSTPSMWPSILSRAKNNGINTIETYVFWNIHQHDKTLGKYDFTGRRNLRQFLQLCADTGLFVTLRIGPYVCGEWDYGGLPLWLQYEKEMRFRSYNEPWMEAMKTWMRDIIDYVRPFYAEHGGPILMSQIENEYHLPDDRYVEWCGELTKTFGLAEPWVMCNGKSATDTINTCNSCYCGSSYVDSHAKKYPDQPLMWTELWQKHERWGIAQFQRDPRDLAYAVVQWVGRGGTHFSYYMWHGGHNYERTAASTLTQHYQDNALLHSDGTLNDPKYHHLGRLHEVLGAYSDVILSKEPDCSIMTGDADIELVNGSTVDNQIMLCEYSSDNKKISFLFSRYPSGTETLSVDFCKMKLSIPPASAVIFNSSCSLLYNTSQILPTAAGNVPMLNPVADQLVWKYWIEPRGPGSSSHKTDERLHITETPIEQLQLTRDSTDFVWYECKVSTSLFNKAPEHGSNNDNILTIATRGSNIFVLFVNGEQKAMWLDHDHTGDVTAILTFSSTLPTTSRSLNGVYPADTITLSILSFAMGISTRVEMATHEEKGITGAVKLNGQDITDGAWSQRPFLHGELDEVFTVEGAARVEWKSDIKTMEGQAMVWLQTTFDVDPMNGPVLLNATGLNLGHAYINGHDIGRYWLLPGECSVMTDCGVHYEEGKCGEPTQTFYHMPPDWLQPESNLLTLIEVAGASDLSQPNIFQKHVPGMYTQS